MRKLRYIAEAVGIYLAFGIFRLLPVSAASALGGALGRTVGPRLAASRKALRNLKQALPGRTEQDYQLIIRDMWDNLGRVIAEYPHLKTIASRRVEICNGALARKIAETNRPAILFSGHLANWETLPVAVLVQHGLRSTSIYRAPNNPYTGRILDFCRDIGQGVRAIRKSRAGARNMVKVLREGGNIGILIDQKYNEGLAIPFFGRPAMTSPAFVELARKYNALLVPIRVERVESCRFRVTLYQELDTDRPTEEVIGTAHRLLEEWITQRPGQWLWLHRRWPQTKGRQPRDTQLPQNEATNEAKSETKSETKGETRTTNKQKDKNAA